MRVREATETDKEHWNAFVEGQGGSIYHCFEWKHIYEAKHWKYIPLLIEDSTEIIGVFPLVRIENALYARLISLPDGPSGGFILKKDLPDRKKHDAITMFLQCITQRYSRKCSTLVFKENLLGPPVAQTSVAEPLRTSGFRPRFTHDMPLPCTHVLRLTPSFEEHIWNGLWGKYLRNHIRKAQRYGLTVKEDPNLTQKEEILHMFSSTYKRFDSRPLSPEEIMLRLTLFKGKTKVWVAYLNGTPFASLLCYNQSSTCFASKMAYEDLAREYYATALLFYEAIRDACENGFRLFEFGVTETDSAARWKQQFKPEEIPLRMYEKRYSASRTFLERVPSLVAWSLQNTPYLWRHKRQVVQHFVRKRI